MITLDEAVIVALVPGIVEIAKRSGLPQRYAGLMAVVCAIGLVALNDISRGGSILGAPAGWIGAGVVYGLAASGLYSQWRQLPEAREALDVPE